MPDSTRVIPLSTALVGDVSIEDLQQQKAVVIPEGTEKIGSYWFCGSEIESVTVPTSVREIGSGAFYGCKSLK